jgi:hypothetical protein
MTAHVRGRQRRRTDAGACYDVDGEELTLVGRYLRAASNAFLKSFCRSGE